MHNPDDNRISRLSRNEGDTAAIGARLATLINPGMVIYLYGDLGAGKTTLVRALLHALGFIGRVKSPTYPLLEHYEAAGLNFCHFDLYRFHDRHEWESAGFRDEFNGSNVCLVEWPQNAFCLLPQSDMDIHFEVMPDGRVMTFCAHSQIGRECLDAL